MQSKVFIPSLQFVAHLQYSFIDSCCGAFAEEVNAFSSQAAVGHRFAVPETYSRSSPETLMLIIIIIILQVVP